MKCDFPGRCVGSRFLIYLCHAAQYFKVNYKLHSSIDVDRYQILFEMDRL